MERKILADLCVMMIGLLHQEYIKGEITKDTYIEHIQTKLTFLKMYDSYGAIDLFIKAMYGNQSVRMVDISSRAVDYTRINALKNSLQVTVLKSDLYSELGGMIFDDIVSNPPFAADKKLNTMLINEAWDHLNP